MGAKASVYVCVGQWVIVSVVALMHCDFHSAELTL